MGSIYLIKDDRGLVEMIEQDYASEDLLQELLANHPSLLAGDQMNQSAPRRWLLVSREAGVPDEENGSNRWSLDHLFLDQDAIPTLVEVKRSTDTRIRREVVGQMLDYAANGVAYWPVDFIRASFENTWKDQGPDAVLREFLQNDSDQDAFWQRVKTNLQAGKIRMVFVADLIPTELQRIVEFLNIQMDPAEVLAVEIKQYLSGDLKTLVPRVIGQTAEAQHKKQIGQTIAWNENSFFAALNDRFSQEYVLAAKRIFDEASLILPEAWWGNGKKDGSRYFGVKYASENYWPLALWTSGKCEFEFNTLMARPAFKDESVRLEFLERLNEIPGVSIDSQAITKFPFVPITLFNDDTALAKLMSALNWFVSCVQRSS